MSIIPFIPDFIVTLPAAYYIGKAAGRKSGVNLKNLKKFL